jgi:hypothetical protein
MKYFSFFLLLLLPLSLLSQEVRTVVTAGEAQVEFPDNLSRQQVEQIAFEKATVDALERAFGRAVIEGNSTFMKNLSTGQQTQTSTVFNMIANTYVKGEVVEVRDKKFEEFEGNTVIDGKKKKIKEVKCTIEVKVRELSDETPDFEAYPLSCLNAGCRKTEFKNNEQLYLYFKSGSAGYLSVFLDDGKVAQSLLPYQAMPKKYENGVPMEGNKAYILFSREPDNTYFESRNITDEIVCASETSLDQNRLFILFSKTPMESPDLQTGLNASMITEFEKEQGYKVPRAMKSEDFQKWLIKSRLRKQDLRVLPIDITIAK